MSTNEKDKNLNVLITQLPSGRFAYLMAQPGLAGWFILQPARFVSYRACSLHIRKNDLGDTPIGPTATSARQRASYEKPDEPMPYGTYMKEARALLTKLPKLFAEYPNGLTTRVMMKATGLHYDAVLHIARWLKVNKYAEWRFIGSDTRLSGAKVLIPVPVPGAPAPEDSGSITTEPKRGVRISAHVSERCEKLYEFLTTQADERGIFNTTHEVMSQHCGWPVATVGYYMRHLIWNKKIRKIKRGHPDGRGGRSVPTYYALVSVAGDGPVNIMHGSNASDNDGLSDSDVTSAMDTIEANLGNPSA